MISGKSIYLKIHVSRKDLKRSRDKLRALNSEEYTKFRADVKTKNRRKENERLESSTESLGECRFKYGHKYRWVRALWSFDPNGIYVANTLTKSANSPY